jgi:NADH-quinone oxidoreductase subunit M
MQEFLDPKILTLIAFLPAGGCLLVCLIPGTRIEAIRYAALAVAVLDFFLSLHLWRSFDATSALFQYAADVPWIGSVGVGYRVGVDGISLFLVLLSTFLTPLALLASWSIRSRVKEYFAFMLLLEAGMVGVFISLDFFLFYFFWEVMLVPMYFLIGVWGGERRIYAATRFVLYTMAGSVLMLIAIFTLYLLHGDATGNYTFAYESILGALADNRLVLTPGEELWLFLAFFAAFAIKVPIFPLHTWLPDAHVEAPTAASILLAGVLLKMGTYGLIRFSLPLFPAASLALAPAIAGLAIVGIVYGALVAMVQPDMKKLVAYSSVSHLGFIVLGIFGFTVMGLEGSVYQMLAHGVSTGALFMLVGVLYDRRHTRLIADYGGVAHRMPLFAALFLFVTLASIGLPGLNGFVGEFLILAGTFLVRPLWAAAAALGVILSAVYMLWMYQRAILGEISSPENQKLEDLTGRELAILLPLAVVIVWMGVHPADFLRPMDASIDRLADRVQSQAGTELNARWYQVDAGPLSFRVPLPALEPPEPGIPVGRTGR